MYSMQAEERDLEPEPSAQELMFSPGNQFASSAPAEVLPDALVFGGQASGRAAAPSPALDTAAAQPSGATRRLEREFDALSKIAAEPEDERVEPFQPPVDVAGDRYKDAAWQSQISSLQSQIEQRAAAPVLSELEGDAAASHLVVGSLDAEELTGLQRTIDAGLAEAASETEELHAARKEVLARTEAEARRNVNAVAAANEKLLHHVEMDQVKNERRAFVHLRKLFRKQESTLRSSLAQKRGTLEQRAGNTVREGNRFGVKNREFGVEWNNAPQPLAVHLRSLRAVKDKLPKGEYVLHVSLFDRLAGHAQRWTSVSAQESRESSGVHVHGGQAHDIELPFDETLRLVLPPRARVAPSMCLVFELFQIREPVSSIVAWGAFPVCDSKFFALGGKFKTPLLVGKPELELNSYHRMEGVVREDLDRWLCNLYFELEPLPLMSPGLRQDYACELQYTSEVLGYSLLDSAKQDAAALRFRPRALPEGSTVESRLDSILNRKSQLSDHGSERLRNRNRGAHDATKNAFFSAEEGDITGAGAGAGTEARRQGDAGRHGADSSAEGLRWDRTEYRHSVVSGVAGHDVTVREELLRERLKVVTRFRVIWREHVLAMARLRPGSKHFVWFLLANVLALALSVLTHYVAQSVLLLLMSVPHSFALSTLDVRYSTEQLTPVMELGVFAVGGCANLLLLALLVCCSGCSMLFFETLSDLASHFVASFCMAVLLDPLLTAIHDVLLWRTQCDALKLFYFYDTQDSDGFMGLMLTFAVLLGCAFVTVRLSDELN